jgi:hypothetical protein
MPFPEPGSQDDLAGCGERYSALLATLALAADVCSGAEDDVAASEASELRDSKACLGR